MNLYDIPFRVDSEIGNIVLVARAVRLGDKIQCTRLSKFFQNGIRIGNARNLNIDSVIAFLIYLGFRTVIFDTLL